MTRSPATGRRRPSTASPRGWTGRASPPIASPSPASSSGSRARASRRCRCGRRPWCSGCCPDWPTGSTARLARRRRRLTGALDTGAGGFLDIVGDFLVYGAFVVGVGVGVGGSLLPFLAVLLAYYVNGAAFLAYSSIAERTGRRLDDGRSLSFVGGLAGGAETVAVHALWCLLPFWAGQIAWVWAAVVAVSATQRVVGGYRTLAAGRP